MRRVVFLMAVSLALAEPPANVLSFFRSAAEALADGDARALLGKFDGKMPEYATLRDEIEALLAAHQVGSTIEIVSDEGNNQKRALELDWLLVISDVGQRRQIIKCKIERRGRDWKITAIDPVGFFKPE